MSIYKLIEKKKREQKKKANIKKAKVVGITSILGISAGAAMGMLLAPKSGKETRTDIINKSKDVKSTLSTKTKNIKNNINDTISQKKSDISDAKTKITEYLANRKNTVNNDESIENINDNINLEGEN